MMLQTPITVAIKKTNTKGRGLFATRPIRHGAVIFHFEGLRGDDAHTNAESLQIDDDAFLESTMKFDDFLNHSCEPNCFIDFEKLNLVALQNIQKGEELTFNYNTTEYDLVNLIEDCSFKCKCGSAACIGEIQGFKFLTLEQQKRVEKYLSPFLKKRYGAGAAPPIKKRTRKHVLNS
jgi:SET domain-containing protein